MVKNYTTINGILIYTTTALLTLIFHESGHFITDKFYGLVAQIHLTYTSCPGFDSATDVQKIVMASAGPLVSLFQGCIFLLITMNSFHKNIFTLFLHWLSLHGFVLFFGYLICSPFFIYGDTGQVFQILHFPIFAIGTISIISVFTIVKILHKLSENFNYYGKDISDYRSRPNQLILYPSIMGGIIVLVLQLPLENFLLLFAVVTIPLMFLIVYGKFKKINEGSPTVNISRLSIPLNIIFTLTVLTAKYLVYY